MNLQLKSIFLNSMITKIITMNLLFSIIINSSVVLAFAPEFAKKHGYVTNTFNSEFNKDVDLYNVKNKNYKWYTDKFFGWKKTPFYNLDANTDDIIIKTGIRYDFATAVPVDNKKKWIGVAFGGGGYFEIELKFNPKDVMKPARKGWPCFWSMSIEHMANLPGKQWPMQAKNFSHFIEVDIFEYLFNEEEKKNQYVINIHESFGIWKNTCPNKQFCTISLPHEKSIVAVEEGTRFDQFHKYGFLWVPATKERDGIAQFYFDRTPVGEEVRWKEYITREPSYELDSWSFSIIDKQHLVLIIGTGTDQPLTLRNVNVWQISSENNLIQY